MIAQLRGKLADKRPNQLLVDVNGVGYLVHIPLSTFYAVVELRDKLAAIALPEAARAASRTGLEADVISALANLGYERRLAEKAVEDVQRTGTGAAGSFEALLRATLQQLSRPGSRAARAE